MYKVKYVCHYTIICHGQGREYFASTKTFKTLIKKQWIKLIAIVNQLFGCPPIYKLDDLKLLNL